MKILLTERALTGAVELHMGLAVDRVVGAKEDLLAAAGLHGVKRAPDRHPGGVAVEVRELCDQVDRLLVAALQVHVDRDKFDVGMRLCRVEEQCCLGACHIARMRRHRQAEALCQRIDRLHARIVGRDLGAVGMDFDAVDILSVFFDKAAQPLDRYFSACLNPQQRAELVGMAFDRADSLFAHAQGAAAQKEREPLVGLVVFGALDAAHQRKVHAAALHGTEYLADAEIEHHHIADMGVRINDHFP